MSLGLKDDTHINENSRFDKLKNTVDKANAKEFFEKRDNIKLKPFQVNQMVDVFRGCIVNRVNGNNLQYKIKGDNKS